MSKNIKTKSEITTMKKAAKILSAALSFAQTIAKPGMTTKELDLAVEKFIKTKSDYFGLNFILH